MVEPLAVATLTIVYLFGRAFVRGRIDERRTGRNKKLRKIDARWQRT